MNTTETYQLCVTLGPNISSPQLFAIRANGMGHEQGLVWATTLVETLGARQWTLTAIHDGKTGRGSLIANEAGLVK